jgi:hypothetical protein
MIAETPGYIRQLHQMQSLPYHFPLLDSHANPLLGTEAFFATILTGDSAHTGAGKKTRTRSHQYRTQEAEIQTQKWDMQLSTAKIADAEIFVFFPRFWDTIQTGF